MIGFQTYILIKYLFSKLSNKFELKSKLSKNQGGQLVIEYVLILSVVTLLATLIIRLLIGQGGASGTPGILLQKWIAVINAIASDVIDN